MTVGSLFSGIGGLDLGLERAGHTVRWQVEANPYCRRILAQHWPDIPCYPDVTHLTAETLEPVDLICGGFPCQPVSVAGAQKGTDDDRWLWPHFAQLLGALRPRYALLENVPGLLTTHGGREFGAILSDLADSGYDAEWDCLPASAVGAPHRRYRVFIIASLPDAERHRAGVQSRHAPSGGQAWEPSHASKPTLVRPADRKADAERLAPSRQDVADADGSGCHPRSHPGSTLPPSSGEESCKPQSGRATQTPDHRRAGTAAADADADRTTSIWASCPDADSLRPRQDAQQRAELDRPHTPRDRRAKHPALAHAEGGVFTGVIGRTAQAFGLAGHGETLANADAQRLEGLWADSHSEGRERSPAGSPGLRGRASRFFDAPIGGEWLPEPGLGRVAHGVPHRVDRLKALGNAVVPQVAEWLGRRLQECLDEQ
jgi:site-specific DNA-cytosine methylase